MNGRPNDICTVRKPAFNTFPTAVPPKVKMLSYNPFPPVPVPYRTVPFGVPLGVLILMNASMSGTFGHETVICSHVPPESAPLQVIELTPDTVPNGWLVDAVHVA